jgi:hypothetical protein
MSSGGNGNWASSGAVISGGWINSSIGTEFVGGGPGGGNSNGASPQTAESTVVRESSRSSPNSSVAALGAFADDMLALLRASLGPRSTVILMLGVPIEGQDHDRFAARVSGPCLSSRGLLAWGERAIKEKIDAEDTSRNGKPHP